MPTYDLSHRALAAALPGDRRHHRDVSGWQRSPLVPKGPVTRAHARVTTTRLLPEPSRVGGDGPRVEQSRHHSPCRTAPAPRSTTLPRLAAYSREPKTSGSVNDTSRCRPRSLPSGSARAGGAAFSERPRLVTAEVARLRSARTSFARHPRTRGPTDCGHHDRKRPPRLARASWNCGSRKHPTGHVTRAAPLPSVDGSNHGSDVQLSATRCRCRTEAVTSFKPSKGSAMLIVVRCSNARSARSASSRSFSRKFLWLRR